MLATQHNDDDDDDISLSYNWFLFGYQKMKSSEEYLCKNVFTDVFYIKFSIYE